jgi:hypothetical protein
MHCCGNRRCLGGLLAAAIALVCQGPACQGPVGQGLVGQGLVGLQGMGVCRAADGSSPAEYETLVIRGRIVWMAEALQRRFGIHSAREARERLAAIETPDGQLHPIVEDTRGGSFRLDPRLRVDGEFLVRRYLGSPMVQVIRIYEITDEGKFELDYWCEICAIAMFELRPCDCCQGPVELRRRKAESKPNAAKQSTANSSDSNSADSKAPTAKP